MAKVQLNVGIPRNLRDLLRRLCFDNGVTVSGVVTELIENWCRENAPKLPRPPVAATTSEESEVSDLEEGQGGTWPE